MLVGSLYTVCTAEAASHRVADILHRGSLRCGIWPHVLGFAAEQDGRFSGFDVDTCRAVATAILGAPTKVDFVPAASVKELAARRDLDLVIRRLTWTPAREQGSGTVFGPVTFFDGQAFLAPRRLNLKSVSQLANASICIVDEAGALGTLHEYFEAAGTAVRPTIVADDAAAEALLNEGKCQAYSGDLSWLAAARARFQNGVRDYALLPQLISKEPLAPLMRSEDTDLLRVVRWTVYSLIEAEEVGVTSANAHGAAALPARAKVFGELRAPIGRGTPGISARALIQAIGNYGELYERNLGRGSALQLERGLNNLWNRGGVLFAPPLER